MGETQSDSTCRSIGLTGKVQSGAQYTYTRMEGCQAKTVNAIQRNYPVLDVGAPDCFFNAAKGVKVQKPKNRTPGPAQSGTSLHTLQVQPHDRSAVARFRSRRLAEVVLSTSRRSGPEVQCLSRHLVPGCSPEQVVEHGVPELLSGVGARYLFERGSGLPALPSEPWPCPSVVSFQNHFRHDQAFRVSLGSQRVLGLAS